MKGKHVRVGMWVTAGGLAPGVRGVAYRVLRPCKDEGYDDNDWIVYDEENERELTAYAPYIEPLCSQCGRRGGEHKNGKCLFGPGRWTL